VNLDGFVLAGNINTKHKEVLEVWQKQQERLSDSTQAAVDSMEGLDADVVASRVRGDRISLTAYNI
jgi:hypothetical protein